MSAARGTETPGVDLGALSEAATPGPWNALQADPTFNPSVGTVDATPTMLTGPEWVAECGPERFADAAYIAALVNAHRDGELIPASAVEAAKAEHREEWASYIANALSMVPPPDVPGYTEDERLAWERMIEMLRGPVPFGVADARGGTR